MLQSFAEDNASLYVLYVLPNEQAEFAMKDLLSKPLAQ